MGAPIGNQNAANARKWRAAIERALDKRSSVAQVDELDRLAGILLDQCGEGDMTALKELGDRLDGKPAQVQVIAGGESGEPVKHELSVIFVNRATGQT